jgi:hypothetical protein
MRMQLEHSWFASRNSGAARGLARNRQDAYFQSGAELGEFEFRG